MNITSKRIIMKILFLSVLFVLGCLQGPWEYDNEEKPTYRGIHVNAYVIADQAVDNVCFEKINELDEFYTAAFPFYQQATITIQGKSSKNSSTEHVLEALTSRPNCFANSGLVPVLGESYNLTAVLTWDSNGRVVTSTLQSSTKIPDMFSIHDSARVSSWALNAGGDEVVSQDFLSLYTSLPLEAQEGLADLYGDTLLALQDTTELENWYFQNSKSIRITIDSLLVLYDEKIHFKDGDSVYYLTGARNTQSQYYSANASEDVGGVLITHKFSPYGIVPTNPFAEIGGFKVTIEEMYFSGQTRRLINYPKVQDSEYSLLDSMGVVNTWLIGGKNTLYFYGMDKAYLDYTETYVQQNNQPASAKLFNIKGGQGVFSGGVLDSFDVYIKVPKATVQFSYFESHAAFCKEEDWNNEDCREWSLEYCKEVAFDDKKAAEENLYFMKNGGYKSCAAELLILALREDYTPDTLETLLKAQEQVTIDSKDYSLFTDLNIDALDFAKKSHCIQTGFEEAYCQEYQDYCEEGNTKFIGGKTGKEYCQLDQWNYCIDNKWAKPSCDWALVTYCNSQNVKSEILCNQASKFCNENPDHKVCRS
jgi:hypothetical protein